MEYAGISLPEEILTQIFEYGRYNHMAKWRLVCREWRGIIESSRYFWRIRYAIELARQETSPMLNQTARGETRLKALNFIKYLVSSKHLVEAFTAVSYITKKIKHCYPYHLAIFHGAIESDTLSILRTNYFPKPVQYYGRLINAAIFIKRWDIMDAALAEKSPNDPQLALRYDNQTIKLPDEFFIFYGETKMTYPRLTTLYVSSYISISQTFVDKCFQHEMYKALVTKSIHAFRAHSYISTGIANLVYEDSREKFLRLRQTVLDNKNMWEPFQVVFQPDELVQNVLSNNISHVHTLTQLLTSQLFLMLIGEQPVYKQGSTWKKLLSAGTTSTKEIARELFEQFSTRYTVDDWKLICMRLFSDGHKGWILRIAPDAVRLWIRNFVD